MVGNRFTKWVYWGWLLGLLGLINGFSGFISGFIGLFSNKITVELSPLTRCVWATKAWRNLVGMERIGASKIPGMIDGLFWGLNCCTSIYSGKIVIIVVQRPHIDLTVISGGNHPLCGLYISGLGICLDFSGPSNLTVFQVCTFFLILCFF